MNSYNYCALHPTGIIAAATSVTPRSVASKLNCAEALRVSCTSTLIPSELMCRFVCGDNGTILDPSPIIKISRKNEHRQNRKQQNYALYKHWMTYQDEAKPDLITPMLPLATQTGPFR